MGFKQMFRMDIVDFEYVLIQISDLISPQEINGGHSPVLCDERFALTLRYFVTGEFFGVSQRFALCWLPTILWGFDKAVCPLLITHNTVGVWQSSLPSADYPQYCGGFTKQFALCWLPTILWGFDKVVCPQLITHNTVGVWQSSLPSADYPQYCGGLTKQFALCWLPTILWGFDKAVCPLLITHNTVGVSQSSLPSADYPQ